MESKSLSNIAKWVGGILSSVIAGYLLLCMTQPKEPKYEGHQLVRTANLGIEFRQDGKRIMMENRSHLLKMKTRGFEIRVPESHWQSVDAEYPAVQIAVSGNASILGIDPSIAFRPGTGAADTEFGSGQLFTYGNGTGPGRHNYIIGNRFNTSEPGFRGFYVSAILDNGRNLFEETSPIYMKFRIGTRVDTAQIKFD